MPTEPTLPPTRLPAPGPDQGSDEARRPPSAGVLERAEAVREGLRSLDVELQQHCVAWLRDRDGLLPVSTPQEWAAVSFLDRVSAQHAGDPVAHGWCSRAPWPRRSAPVTRSG